MGNPLKVLIIEDSEADAELLVRQLKKGGYEASWERVETLEAMTVSLDKPGWDLLVSDHSMPRFSAIDALNALKERSLDVPVIILSGTIEEEKAVAAMRAGASDYIMKGNTARLLPAIERELREAQARRKARKVEEQFRQAQKMEAIGRLAGGVAHDFNNILTAVSGYAHFLLNVLAPEDPKRADVEEIQKAGERAAALTRQLLAFSRQQVLQPKVLDLNALVRNLEKMLRRIIGEDLDVLSILADDLGRISADPGQIEQVLLNLAVNARDAMPRGGKITIETKNAELTEDYAGTRLECGPGPYVLLAVSDTGTGMDEKTVSRLFEPFFTTKEQGKGTGLGLSTVYGIVKQSGGGVSVYSEPGHGSVFKVFLPRIEEKGAGPAAAAAPPAVVSLRGSETVLLVEDDEAVRKFVSRLLAQNGYAVLEARNPDEALRISARTAERVHLLLTDIIMPGMRGDELALSLSSRRPDMKIVFTSGYTEAGLIRHNMLGPASVFVQKPIDPAALTRAIREVLDRPGAEGA